MVNILPHAYFSEFLQLCFAVIAWIFVAGMVFSTGVDLQKALDALTGDSWKVRISLIFQGKGYFTAELWRLLETSLLLVVGIWSLTHSANGQPVIFWDLQNNLRADRIVLILITMCKMNAAFTARYFRHKANLADGVTHD